MYIPAKALGLESAVLRYIGNKKYYQEDLDQEPFQIQ